jgi:hypothetical protein
MDRLNAKRRRVQVPHAQVPIQIPHVPVPLQIPHAPVPLQMPHLQVPVQIPFEQFYREQFTDFIREASLGSEYTIDHSVIHDIGDHAPFEELVRFARGGILEWYIRQAGLLPVESVVLYNLVELQEICACFYRLKIIVEKLNRLRVLYDHQFFTGFYLPIEEFNRRMGIIETFLDRVQCLIWYRVVNHSFPNGFVMDRRIQYLAHTPFWNNPIDQGILSFSIFQNEIIGKTPEGFDRSRVIAIRPPNRYQELLFSTLIDLSEQLVPLELQGTRKSHKKTPRRRNSRQGK